MRSQGRGIGVRRAGVRGEKWLKGGKFRNISRMRTGLRNRWLNVRQPMTSWSGLQNRYWSKKLPRISTIPQLICKVMFIYENCLIFNILSNGIIRIDLA